MWMGFDLPQELALGMRAGADRQVQTYRRVFALD